MAKPFDFTKLCKDHNKKRGCKSGFNDPITWIDTGNKALNKMISGDFGQGIPLGAVTVFAGESGCLPASAKVTVRTKTVNWTTECEVSVGELRGLFHFGAYKLEIDTPDGFQPIVKWFDKGVLSLVTITTLNDKSTRCAFNHPIQRSDETWVLAHELTDGDEIITIDGLDTVWSIDKSGEDLCYDFEVDHPNHRYWGDGISSHNSAKSYIVSGNVVRNALAQGITVVVVDSEDALKTKWVTNLGVDPEHPNLVKYVKNTVDEITQCITDFTDGYREDYRDTPREDQPKLLFVIDSLGFVETQADIEQFEKGQLKGDKGIKAKMLKMFVGNCIRLFAGYEIGLVATNHTYKSQDMYSPDDVISGGSGFIFAASIIVSMNKKKLKGVVEKPLVKGVRGPKPDTVGIIAKIKCVKTRYSKPFEEVEVSIPYSTGMDPYSGLFDMFEASGLIQKAGPRYKYVDKAGEEHVMYRKDITNAFYDMIISEYDDNVIVGDIGVDETVAEEDNEHGE